MSFSEKLESSLFDISRQSRHSSQGTCSLLPQDIEDLGKRLQYQADPRPRFTRLCAFQVHSDTDSISIACLEESTGLKYEVVLKEDWLGTAIIPGHYVNIIGEFSSSRTIIIDNNNGLLIQNPDVLLGGTCVGQSFSCIRKAVLSDKVRGHQTSPAALYGRLTHQIFQMIISVKAETQEELQRCADNVIGSAVESLFEVGHDEEAAKTRLYPTLDILKKFHVTNLLGVEEQIWSLMYGLNGQIDLSVELEFQDSGRGPYAVAPLEVKTGKFFPDSHLAYRAQVLTYCLLMSDRYKAPITTGLLYYTNPGNSSCAAGDIYLIDTRSASTRNEIRHILIGRNALSRYFLEDRQVAQLLLPPVLGKRRECESCPLKPSCMIYHKILDHGTPESSGLGAEFSNLTTFSEKESQFFVKWDKFIELESRVTNQNRRDLWMQTSSFRQKSGHCISNLKLVSQDLNTLTYTFQSTDPTFSPSAHELGPGSFVLLSTEEGFFGLARGSICKASARNIAVAVKGQLKPPPILFPDHRYAGIEEQGQLAFRALACLRWRLDTDDGPTITRLVRTNLVNLFRPEARRLRELIIELEEPTFSPIADKVDVQDLNNDQRLAVNKVLSANDYALVLGMPGTGKTTALATLVKELASRGKSILLTSFTHSAIDNILLKLKEMRVNFLRVGRTNAIHPDLRDYVLEQQPFSTVAEYDNICRSSQVVAATCYAMDHGLFKRRSLDGLKFDFCLVDEASQLTLPVSLGPLSISRVFVLVGDQYQLPPLLLEPSSRKVIPSTEVSLFRRLSSAHDSVVSRLSHQYRMNAEIMTLPNRLIYNGRLKCGSDAVAQARLSIPFMPPAESPWLESVLNPNLSVLFLDTDSAPGVEERSGDTIINRFEASIVARSTQTLLAAGLQPQQIGIIAPYRAQLKAIRSFFAEVLSSNDLESLEIHTVDKYQGRDKDCMIISFVRSNPGKTVGDLLADWHRINVAITRAKKKLILVGSRSTLASHPLLDSMFSVIQSLGNERIVALPPVSLTKPLA